MRRYAFVALLLVPAFAHAQFALPGFTGVVRIGMSPANPGPQQDVVLTLESSLIDLAASEIAWRVDGMARGPGESIAVRTGKLGSTMHVTAAVTTPEGSLVTASLDIAPTELDLLYDSDTYVPPLYRGRALPSAGSTVRLQAIPHFVKPSGAEVPASDVIFAWKRNGQLLGSLSGKGRAAITVPAPYLYGADTVSVEARTADDAFAGASSVTIPAVDPIVRLYQDHPLFGLRFDRALGTTTALSDREMTFAAIPYFASARGPAAAPLTYAWSVNGNPVETAGDTKNELTIGAESGGSALLDLDLSSTDNIFFGAAGSWRIAFGEMLTADNPFFSNTR